MKCYSCGKLNGEHLSYCPAKKSKPKPEILDDVGNYGPDTPELPTSVEIAPQYLRPAHRSAYSSIRERTPPRLFLIGGPNVDVPGMQSMTIGFEPAYFHSKILRLWIDATIAQAFDIVSMGIGVNIFMTGNIPATLFQTGSWPLSEAPVKQFGIDLSSWRAMQVGEKFIITVCNRHLSLTPFRAVLETMSIVL